MCFLVFAAVEATLLLPLSFVFEVSRTHACTHAHKHARTHARTHTSTYTCTHVLSLVLCYSLTRAATSTVDESTLTDAASVLDGDTLLTSITSPEPNTLSFSIHTRSCCSGPALTALAGLAICRDPSSRILWAFNPRERTIVAYDPLLSVVPKPAPGIPDGVTRPEAVLMAPSAVLPSSERSHTTTSQAAVAILASIDSLNRGRVSMCVCVCVCVCVFVCRVSCRVVSCRVVSCRVVSCVSRNL
jgi:hypothetical protein